MNGSDWTQILGLGEHTEISLLTERYFVILTDEMPSNKWMKNHSWGKLMTTYHVGGLNPFNKCSKDAVEKAKYDDVIEIIEVSTNQ